MSSFVAMSALVLPVFLQIAIGPGDFKVIASKSGPTNYYTPMTENGVSFIRSKYLPGMKTTVLGWKTPDGDRRSIKKVKWTWRANTFPNGGDECTSGKEDSAAVVYVSWKSGLRYHTLKYVWSAVGKKGTTCDRKRNPFVAQDTIIVDSGGATGQWRTVEIDLASEYKNHFGDDPPDFVGIGIMSDGDQTNSESSADFGGFTLAR